MLLARTEPDGARYEFTHDSNLRLTRVTNPQRLTWDYGYDPAGQLISETDFDNRTLRYERDAAGRLAARTSAAGQTTCYERDVLGRVVRKNAAGTTTTFAYDFADHLAEAVNEDATVTLLRDRYGRLVSETVNGRTMSYTYDALGRRIGRTTPPARSAPGPTTPPAAAPPSPPPAAPSPSNMTPSARDAEDRLTAVTTPDGARWRYEYDASGRRIAKLRLSEDGTTVIERSDFTWDGPTLCEQTTVSDESPHWVTLTWDHDGLRPVAQTERIMAVVAQEAGMVSMALKRAP